MSEPLADKPTLRSLLEKEIKDTEAAIMTEEMNVNMLRGQAARIEESIRFRHLHIAELRRMLKEDTDGVAG